jgi:hypothetical protein
MTRFTLYLRIPFSGALWVELRRNPVGPPFFVHERIAFEHVIWLGRLQLIWLPKRALQRVT